VVEPRFLLDTNILVYLVGGSSEPLRRRVEECVPGVVVTSTICVAEAAFGWADDPGSKEGLHRLLGIINPLPFDLTAALRFAEIPFRRGKSDRWIAAHTLALGLVLVTNNERDFADVPGLKIENWTRV
jgi:tRNA(fMet)-specific endonuclease VapC